MVGIKVRIGGDASGASGIAPMEMALEVAEHAGIAADDASRRSAAAIVPR